MAGNEETSKFKFKGDLPANGEGAVHTQSSSPGKAGRHRFAFSGEGRVGQLAVEGMYFGKPVCCYLTDSLKEQFPDCPIVSCTIDDLQEKLAWLIDLKENRRGRRLSSDLDRLRLLAAARSPRQHLARSSLRKDRPTR